MIPALAVLIALLSQLTVHAGQPEVMATVGETDGNVIGEEVVLDKDNRITVRHNYLTDTIEDFNTGFEAMKGKGLGNFCVIEFISKGKQAQEKEEQQLKDQAGKLQHITWDTSDAEPAEDLRKKAGKNIDNFCGKRKAIKLTSKTTRVKRGWGKAWETVKKGAKKAGEFVTKNIGTIIEVVCRRYC